MMMLHDLVKGLADPEITGPPDVMIRTVTGDSRNVQPQDVFVAVRGTVIDGHEKVSHAVENGATVVIGERHVADIDFGHGEPGVTLTYVRVADTRRAHAALLRASHPEIVEALSSITFYGVTGTNGKTTVATLLEQMLNASGTKSGFIGTTGIRYDGIEIEATHTTPDVERLYEIIVMMHRAGVQAIAMEVSSHALDQGRVDGIVFSGALFTNLTRDHLDYHHTMEAYAAAKHKLFLGLPADAVAVFNGDDSWSFFMRRDCPTQATISVGITHGNDVEIINVSCSAEGASFTLRAHAPDEEPYEFTIHTPLLGHFNVMNAALCVVLLWARGLAVPILQSIMKNVHGPRGRMERITLRTHATAVVDYAHTPDALEKALSTIRDVMHEHGARLHVVFGCGGDRDPGKRAEMGKIAARDADMIWITNDNPRTEDPRHIIDAILSGIPEQIRESDAVHAIEDRRHAIIAALMKAHPHDVALIAGKGHEDYQIIGTEKIPFSDRAIVDEFNG